MKVYRTERQVILLKQIIICFARKQINALLWFRKTSAQIYLVKNGVLSLEASAGKLDNLLVGARLLPTKLVARESQDFKSLALVLLVHLAQLGVVGVS
jgi:hypothetical protein